MTDQIKQLLEESLTFHSLRNEDVSDHKCELSVVVQLSEKDVLLVLILTSFESHSTECVDQEALDRENEQLSKLWIIYNGFEGFLRAAVLSTLNNVLWVILGEFSFNITLCVGCSHVIEVLKEHTLHRNTQDFCNASSEASIVRRVCNALSYLLKDSLNLTLLTWLCLVTRLVTLAEHHFQNLILVRKGI